MPAANAAITGCNRLILLAGAPEGIRTPDLCLRRATLYPAELRARGVVIADGRRGSNAVAAGDPSRPGDSEHRRATTEPGGRTPLIEGGCQSIAGPGVST